VTFLRRVEVYQVVKRSSYFAIALALGTACNKSPFALVPVDPELRAAPTEIAVGATTVRLEASLWRDFQPVSPPDGKPLVAVLRIRAIAGGGVPADLHPEFAWVLNGRQAWASDVGEERREPSGAFIEVVARDGPKWGPRIEVDVVVRLRDASGRVQLLQVRGQPIGRTD